MGLRGETKKSGIVFSSVEWLSLYRFAKILPWHQDAPDQDSACPLFGQIPGVLTPRHPLDNIPYSHLDPATPFEQDLLHGGGMRKHPFLDQFHARGLQFPKSLNAQVVPVLDEVPAVGLT